MSIVHNGMGFFKYMRGFGGYHTPQKNKKQKTKNK